MKFIKRQLRKIVYAVPGTQALWIELNKKFGREGKPDFSGWGMVTRTFPPWRDGGGDTLTREFLQSNQSLIAKVKSGEFRLSQFESAQNKKRVLTELMWRHYVVFWSASYAAAASQSSIVTMAECGVCDGLTAYFAICAVAGNNDFRAFLYDAWEGMKSEYLLESEQRATGAYSFLSLEQTKRNLDRFAGNTVFNKGFIPDSFVRSENPLELNWLHIDLNSAIPTLAALELFFMRIRPGGIILFDDYGWHGFQDTKTVVDKFFEGKSGFLLPFPTGQAIYFKQ
ncbi:MAG: class I SAM-dependent methyltransferase [Gemmatimonadota bacterium]|nr:class I SAM-dependent methyltransferase [Gemmatimonadota bacterium]